MRWHREETTLKTYDFFEILGVNSQKKSSRVRRAGVNEIDYGIEVYNDVVVTWREKYLRDL